ncbi:MAG: hypothetical protein M3512_12485, partial [Bacteroidota bacterium]|nr:hypothetical protein [Bacteroidota bacterium]
MKFIQSSNTAVILLPYNKACASKRVFSLILLLMFSFFTASVGQDLHHKFDIPENTVMYIERTH